MTNISIVINSISPPPPDLRMSRRPPGTAKVLAHDWSVDDGAHDKPPYEPRGYDLPETEPLIHSEGVRMISPLANLWFDLFSLCAPKDLELLPESLCYDAKGVRWLSFEWYDRLMPIEQWWLFLIYWARAFTNKVSINLPGYFDPITGFGVPNSDGSMKEFIKLGVATCGNMLCIADGVGGGGVPVWCLDATPEAIPYLPTAEKLLEYPWLCHAATISTTHHPDPTILPNAPKGRWDVDPFGYLRENVVPVPMFSIWTGQNAATMIYDGMRLRVNWFAPTRIEPLVEPWSPYFPARPLFPAQ